MTILDHSTEILGQYTNERVIEMTNTEFFEIYLEEIELINPHTMTISEYTELVRIGELPTFEGITRSLRKARENNHKWQKSTIRKRVEENYMQAIIGY
jgi:hypothetical protein